MTELDRIGEAVATFSTCYPSLVNHLKSIIHFGAVLGKRDIGISIWLSIIWTIQNLKFIGGSVTSCSTCYLSSRVWPTSIIGFCFILKERYKALAFWLLTLCFLTNLECIVEAARSSTPCYLSPRTWLKRIISAKTSLEKHDGVVS